MVRAYCTVMARVMDHQMAMGDGNETETETRTANSEPAV
jgi:hypothetical protein